MAVPPAFMRPQVISCPYKQLRYPALAPGPSPKHGRGVPEGRGEGSYNKSLTGHDIIMMLRIFHEFIIKTRNAAVYSHVPSITNYELRITN